MSNFTRFWPLPSQSLVVSLKSKVTLLHFKSRYKCFILFYNNIMIWEIRKKNGCGKDHKKCSWKIGKFLKMVNLDVFQFLLAVLEFCQKGFEHLRLKDKESIFSDSQAILNNSLKTFKCFFLCKELRVIISFHSLCVTQEN